MIEGLITPPWTKGAKLPPARIVTGLTVQARPERIRKGGMLEYAYDFRTFAPGGERALGKKQLAATKAQIAANVKAGAALRPVDICWLPPAEGLALWNDLSVKFAFETFSLRVITAVFDMPSIDATFARIARGEVMDPDHGPNFTAISTALDGISQIDSPRVAPVMLRAWFDEKKTSDAHGVAEDWFLRMPETAAVALVPAAVGPLGKARDEAGEILRLLARRGSGDVVKRVAQSYGADAASAIAEVLGARSAKKMKAPALPAWLAPAKLPRVNGLDDEVLTNLLRYAAAWPPELVEVDEPIADQNPYGRAPDEEDEGTDDPLELSHVFKVHVADWHPCLHEAKRTLNLAALGAALFDAWLAAGAKESWVLFAAAFFGGERVAKLVAPEIRAWRTAKQSARVTLGLDALVLSDSDHALAALDDLAHRPELKALALDAGCRLRRLARLRGLRPDEIADRVVPAGELDEKTKRAVVETQTRRLEDAMLARKRWPRDAFDAYVVKQPIVGPIARALVFGAYDAKGALVTTFRITDEGLGDAADRTIEVDRALALGIVHPIELDAKTLHAWSNRVADDEIIQPFPQLGRETYTPDAKERASTVLARVHGRRVTAGALLGLERIGYTRERDDAHRSLMVGYAKWMAPALDVLVSFSPGIELKKLGASGDQTLGDVVLRRISGGALITEERAPFGELDAIGFSELVRTLTLL